MNWLITGGETFQIAANTESTVGELAERVLAVLQRHGIGEIPVNYGEPRVGDVARNFSDTRKAAERLGWKPDYTLDQGLERTVTYFLNEQTSGAL